MDGMWGDKTIIAGAPLGAWLLVAPFTVYGEMLAPNFWNDIIVGTAVLVLAFYGGIRVWREKRISIAAGILLALLGLWQVTRPFLVATAGPVPRWGDAAIGVLLCFLGGRVIREARRPTRLDRSTRSEVGGD